MRGALVDYQDAARRAARPDRPERSLGRKRSRRNFRDLTPHAQRRSINTRRQLPASLERNRSVVEFAQHRHAGRGQETQQRPRWRDLGVHDRAIFPLERVFCERDSQDRRGLLDLYTPHACVALSSPLRARDSPPLDIASSVSGLDLYYRFNLRSNRTGCERPWMR